MKITPVPVTEQIHMIVGQGGNIGLFTGGDSVIFFKTANVIHTGDIFFNSFYPFIDVNHGGSLKGMIKAVDKILSLADDNTKIIAGHGPLGLPSQHLHLLGVAVSPYQEVLSKSRV